METLIKPIVKDVQFSTPAAGIGIRHDLATVVQEATGDDRLIADLVLPPFGSDVKQGTYPKIRLQKGNLLKADITKRGPDGEYGLGSRQWETDTFECADYGRAERVSDVNKRDVAKYFDDEVLAMTQATRAVRLAREIRAAALLMANDDTYATGFHKTAAAVAYTEANIATIDMARDVLTAIDTLELRGYTPNAIVIPSQVWLRARRSTLLQNFLRGAGVMASTRSGAGVDMLVTEDLMAKAFGLEKCYIGRGVYDSAAEGKTPSLSRAWGNTYFWVGTIKDGDPRNGGAGRTFYWTADGHGDSGGGLIVSESYRDEVRRGDVVRARQTVTEKLIDTLCGELITTSYA